MSVEFVLKIADIPIGVSVQFPETRLFCGEYLTDEAPAVRVSVDREDIAVEREKSDRERVMEGVKPHAYSDGYLETLALYRKIAEALLDWNILLFHGSAVSVDGYTYLFTAKSGTGKSTHTRLWRELLGERAVMVNDDKPMIRIGDGQAFVCGTPWNGKHRLGSKAIVPLGAICILERSETNRIEPVTRAEAMPMFLQQSYRPAQAGAMIKTMRLVDALSGCADLYRMGCNMDISAAEMAYTAMRKI